MKHALLAAGVVAEGVDAGPAMVVMEDDRIAAVGLRAALAVPADARVTDLGAALVSAGLVDIHIHGGAGFDLMSGGADAVAGVGRHLARHGVTSFVPTTVSAAREPTLRALRRLAAALAAEARTPSSGAAQPLGLHLEGPFLSPRQRGVHPENVLEAPSVAHWQTLHAAGGGRILLLTLAPELGGALAVIAQAVQDGVCVSLGHSDATREQAQAAIAAGARHVTHTFNAMAPLHHRAPGLLGETLANPGLSAEIIADGLHVDAAVVAMFLRLKGPRQAVLVSDAIAAAGCGDGESRLGELRVEVRHGVCRCDGRLAGSLLTLDRAVANAAAYSGSSWRQTVPLASANPARVLGVPRGELLPGSLADVVAWRDGVATRVWLRGRER